MQAIVVGPPSDEFKGGDGRWLKVGQPFRELARCFKDAKHWTAHPLQASLEEVVLDRGRMSKVPEGGIKELSRKQRHAFEEKRMWDASVKINIPKLIKLVGLCLGEDGRSDVQ
jgi:hypothetical protein